MAVMNILDSLVFSGIPKANIEDTRQWVRMWWICEGRHARMGARMFVAQALTTNRAWNDYVMQFEEEQHNG